MERELGGAGLQCGGPPLYLLSGGGAGLPHLHFVRGAGLRCGSPRPLPPPLVAGDDPPGSERGILVFAPGGPEQWSGVISSRRAHCFRFHARRVVAVAIRG